MQLIVSPPSPYARKARVVLRELNLMDTVQELDVTTSPVDPSPAALASNPTGRIPSLIRGDGPALYDSRVITRFLNDLGNGTLYPDAHWDVLTLEATGDAIMDSAVGMVYEQRLRPAAQQSDTWLDAQWGKVMGAVTALETRWMPLLTGPLHMGQISVACALTYLDLRHDDRGWRAQHTTLADWVDQFATRDSMVATHPNL
ncbi:MAG: glutathione S-transferase family protein [Pseudomonadota bacterium]